MKVGGSLISFYIIFKYKLITRSLVTLDQVFQDQQRCDVLL